MEGAVLALCIEHLHRHPLELGHLPSSAMADLMGYSMILREQAEA